MGNCCFTFFHRPNFLPSREDTLSSKRREREREKGKNIYDRRHDRSLKIKYPTKVSFCALKNFFFFLISLLQGEGRTSTIEGILRNKSVCGTEYKILLILLFPQFLHAPDAGFQPPFPAETRFPDRESARGTLHGAKMER